MREQAKRRRFSAEYKLRIVREADAFGKGDGDVAALLRREGLYSSQLSSWRRQRDEIAKVGMTSRKRGRKAKAEDPRVKELERENARLQRRLARVETMLEIQKKTSELLGIPLERQSLLRVSVQDDEVLSSVSEPLWFRRRRPAILLRFLRLLQFSPPALGNRPYDTGRRSLWSSRTAHHRSAPDPSRSSTGSSRTLRSRNAATARFASAGLDQPAAGKNDPPRCRTSPSRGGVHTWGTSFFCFTQRDLDRC